MKKVAIVSNSDRQLFQIHSSFLVSLKEAGFSVSLFSSCDDPAIVKKFTENGFTVRLWRGGWFPLRFAFALLRLSPGLVHFHTLKGAGLAAWICLKFGVTGVVFSASPGCMRLSFAEKFLFRLLAGDHRVHFFSFGPQVRSELEKEFPSIRSEQLTEMRGDGIDVNRFHPPRAERVMVDGQPVRILFASPYHANAGFSDLRQACLILRAKKIEFELFCAESTEAGEVWDPSELKAWIKEGWMRWVGRVESMESLIRSAEIAVLPSVEPAASRFLLEAAASGRAILAAASPGAQELIVQEQSGLLYPAGDSSSLARALERLIKDDALRATLGTGARLCAEGLFDEKPTLERVRAVYESLLSHA